MDRHIGVLNSLCRVGGVPLPPSGRRYPAIAYASGLRAAFAISIDSDSPSVHPTHICGKCERVVFRVTSGAAHSGGGCAVPREWVPHSRSDCSLCSDLSDRSKGGRPAKKKYSVRTRPAVEGGTHVYGNDAHSPGERDSTCIDSDSSIRSGMNLSSEEVFRRASPSYKTPDRELSLDRFVFCCDEIVCSICHLVVDQAVEARCCQKLFCASCICFWLDTHCTCPLCKCRLMADELAQPHPLVVGIISKCIVMCDFSESALVGCPVRVPLAELTSHVSLCRFNPAVESAPLQRVVESTTTIGDMLSASPSKLRGKVFDKVLKHVVSTCDVDGKLEVRGGGGSPAMYRKTTVARVASGACSSKTERRRSVLTDSVTRQVCGGEIGAVAHMAAKVRGMASRERDTLLLMANLKPLASKPGTALAIKADMQLPWYQLRKLQKWFTSFGISLESERVTRQYLRDCVPKYCAENVPLSVKEGISLCPMIFIQDLVGFVFHMLSLHDCSGTLYHHEGIPTDQVWVKFGGDHGGKSFKFCFQIVNTKNPNSFRNTIPVCVFSGKDNPANLETALGLYRAQLEKLSSSEWESGSGCKFKIKILLCGDYEFLTTLYGLSGASGLHPCLFCTTDKKNMQLPPEHRLQSTPRTLDTLHTNHMSFIEAGGNLIKAKFHCNVIRPAILQFPINDVCIPVLHLDLGIFAWLYEAMMKDVLELDELLGKLLMQANQSDSECFRSLCESQKSLHDCQALRTTAVSKCNNVKYQLDYVVCHAQRSGLTMHLQALAGTLQLQWTELSKEVEECIKNEEEAKRKAEKALEKKISGPCLASLEEVLQQFSIERQAYHGGAFIGNHVHKALSSRVVKKLTAAPSAVISSRLQDLSQSDQTAQAEAIQSLSAQAYIVQERYTLLLSQYSGIHSIMSSSSTPSLNNVQELSSAISNFLASCRQHVTSRRRGNITPKLHLLEAHVIECLQHFSVGLGLINEQGAESIHHAFNSLQRTYSSISNQLDRLRSCVEAHLVNTLPQTTSLIPSTKRRHSV